MNRATEALVTRVKANRRTVLDDKTGRSKKETWRAMCDRMKIPRSKVATVHRIGTGGRAISVDLENEIRPYFDMEPIDEPHLIVDTREYDIRRKEGRTRPERVSTDFNPEVFAGFQDIRDTLQLSNDEALDLIVKKYHRL